MAMFRSKKPHWIQVRENNAWAEEKARGLARAFSSGMNSITALIPAAAIPTHFGAAIEGIDIAIGKTPRCRGLALLVAGETAISDWRQPLFALDTVGIVTGLNRSGSD
jgi:hypothetical protein